MDDKKLSSAEKIGLVSIIKKERNPVRSFSP